MMPWVGTLLEDFSRAENPTAAGGCFGALVYVQLTQSSPRPS